ncbi:hypothetical protein Plhal703r1_c02g0009921 [Plasmopara halstedii]
MIQVVLFKQKFALLSNNKVFFILLDVRLKAHSRRKVNGTGGLSVNHNHRKH